MQKFGSSNPMLPTRRGFDGEKSHSLTEVLNICYFLFSLGPTQANPSQAVEIIQEIPFFFFSLSTLSSFFHLRNISPSLHLTFPPLFFHFYPPPSEQYHLRQAFFFTPSVSIFFLSLSSLCLFLCLFSPLSDHHFISSFIIFSFFFFLSFFLPSIF